MKSLEDSLQRLDLNEIDILYLHDPDNHPDHFQDAKVGALKAMIKLRDEGVVKAIGCGMNQNEMLIEFAKEGCFDCFLYQIFLHALFSLMAIKHRFQFRIFSLVGYSIFIDHL